MTDAFTVVTGTFGILGTVGGITSTITAVHASGVRRHVERAHGASALLNDLDTLPAAHANGTRLITPADETELRGELSRIVRENAAAYAKQNPTPVGFDFARVLMPGYFILFAFFAVTAFIAAHHQRTEADAVTQRVAAGVFLVFALVFLVITGLLHERMLKRNDARRIAGTPGREYYFGPIAEIWQYVAGAIRKRRARQRAAGGKRPAS
jgi:hypothetical protein